MSKTLFTADQVDNSIVKTKDLNSLGLLTKSQLGTLLKAGPGIKIDVVPNVLALWHFEDSQADALNNVDLLENQKS